MNIFTIQDMFPLLQNFQVLCTALRLNSQYVSNLWFILVITASIYVLIWSILKLSNANLIEQNEQPEQAHYMKMKKILVLTMYKIKIFSPSHSLFLHSLFTIKTPPHDLFCMTFFSSWYFSKLQHYLSYTCSQI